MFLYKPKTAETMSKLFLKKVTTESLTIFTQQHRLLFPIEYNKLFFDTMISDTQIYGFHLVLKNQQIGVLSYRVVTLKMGYIMTFGLVHNQRRMGYGRQALSLIEKNMKNMKINSIRLHVQSTNYSGLEFYKRNGFYIKKHEINYYKTILPTQAYMLEKKI